MSWINWIFGKTEEQKRIKCLEDLSFKAFDEIRKLEEKLLHLRIRLDTAESKIKVTPLYLDQITTEIDNRLKRLESESSFFNEIEKHKKKAGRPKKDKSK